jgi:hypothetical protein
VLEGVGQTATAIHPKLSARFPLNPIHGISNAWGWFDHPQTDRGPPLFFLQFFKALIFLKVFSILIFNYAYDTY